MKDLNVIFMGTPLFSVPILEELIKNTNVIGVVCSPDALVGRKKVLTPCPIKEKALENNIKVISPKRLREEYDEIIDLKPDIIITCAYGQIVPKEVLDSPRLGCINIHASLLPKYRGASPIIHAIMDGEKETGITLMYMAEGLDTGDIIKSEKVVIEDDDNLETLSNKLSLLGSKMIIEELPNIINGTNERVKQNDEESTYVGLIKREDEHLDFNDTTINIYNKIRAFSPSPYVNFLLDDNEYKLVDGFKCESNSDKEPGTIIEEDKNSFTVKTQDGGIKITKIKPVGKNIMNVSDFKNGYHDVLVGKVLR